MNTQWENRKDMALMIRICALLTGLFLLVGSAVNANPIAAQDSAAGCAIPAVELPLFDGTPAAEIPGAVATPASPDDPARDATQSEIDEYASAIDLILRCINTGEARYSNAIFTERYLASKFADPNLLYQPDFERMIAENTGNVPDAAPLQIDNIDNVTIRDDGRMSGRVTFSSAGSSWRDTLVLKEVDSRWLVDDVILETR